MIKRIQELTLGQKIGLGIGSTGCLLIIIGAATSLYTELIIIGTILLIIGGALLYIKRKQSNVASDDVPVNHDADVPVTHDGFDIPEDIKHRFNQNLSRLADEIPNVLEKVPCLRGYSNLKYHSHGVYGIVCFVQRGQDEYAVKFQWFIPDIAHEIDVLKRFSDVEIGVKLIEHCNVSVNDTEEKISVIITEKMEGVLMSVLGSKTRLNNRVIDDIMEQVFHMLDVMERNKISHNDMHFGNIGYFIRHDNSYRQRYVLKLIDFGLGFHSMYRRDLNVLSFAKSLFQGYNDPELIKPENIQYIVENYSEKLKGNVEDKYWYNPYNINTGYERIRAQVSQHALQEIEASNKGPM
jgi:tRNA A-37 threonylcarbamoyl transferase component Bud32